MTGAARSLLAEHLGAGAGNLGRPLVLCVPCWRLASCQRTMRCRMSARGSRPKISSEINGAERVWISVFIIPCPFEPVVTVSRLHYSASLNALCFGLGRSAGFSFLGCLGSLCSANDQPADCIFSLRLLDGVTHA
jgi:hypothetical protein